MAGLVELLSCYPEDVLQEAASPVRGLPSKHTFMPSIAEVKSFCDAIRNDRRRHDELVERWCRPKLAPPEPNRAGRVSLEEMKAKSGPSWGIGGDANDVNPPFSQTVADDNKRFSDIPDAPARKLPNGMALLGDIAKNVVRGIES